MSCYFLFFPFLLFFFSLLPPNKTLLTTSLPTKVLNPFVRHLPTRERERQTDRQTETETERQREKENVNT